MKTFIKLTLLTALMIFIVSMFFEYVINRPFNVYMQYVLSTVMLIAVVIYVVYLVKELIKVLNSNPNSNDIS